jgi:hypothetical protein
MTATQGSNHVWNITKALSPQRCRSATRARLEQHCPPPSRSPSAGTKLPADASGPITVVTNVYATTPRRGRSR